MEVVSWFFDSATCVLLIAKGFTVIIIAIGRNVAFHSRDCVAVGSFRRPDSQVSYILHTSFPFTATDDKYS